MKYTPLLSIYFLLFFFSIQQVNAQCTTLGQNPGTAFPVCGTSKFSQQDVPLCGGKFIPSPCSVNEGLSDLNPFWYKFTAFTDGTLGFVITPATLSDDYDWQVFDITGKNPNDVYTDAKLFVASNWSGEGGTTGASTRGTSLSVCGGLGKPTYSSMPQLKKGHEYLLLVSHFTSSQSGYSLEFKGGTASITDVNTPAFVKAAALCDATRVDVILNKKMRCSSLAADGSDFIFSDPSISIKNASARRCNIGFDMDTLQLLLDKPLPAGNYKLSAKKGTDGNTILDYCNNPIEEGDEIGFTVLPIQPTPFDSIVPVQCAPAVLDFVFPNNILCNSVDPAGKDFLVSGPSQVIINSATVTCNDSKTKTIRLNLSAPITVGGIYSVQLRKGPDGNTLIDECSQETPVGSSIEFSIKDTVSADFSMDVQLQCGEDLVRFEHDGSHQVNEWKWTFDNTISKVGKVVNLGYSTSGDHTVFLKVSNGFCTDSITKTFALPEKIKALFTHSEVVCPNEAAGFVEKSSGPVTTWEWNFGNGNRSADKDPQPQYYAANGREHTEKIRLIVSDGQCKDTAESEILVVTSCMIAVPSAFTPNGDGKNDYLYPSNAYKAEGLTFQVFNRYGQKVFETKDWRKRWDGTYNGKFVQAGTYVWALNYTLISTGKKYTYKGTTVLIR